MVDTEWEERFVEALKYTLKEMLGQSGPSYVYTEQVLCFFCGEHWRHLGDNMPHSCQKCGNEYDNKFQYCKPDTIIDLGNGKRAIVLINGWPHTKKNIREKDKHQIENAQVFKYKAFVINNDQIDGSTKSWLRFAVWSIYNAVANDKLYCIAYRGETEYYGLRVACS